MRHSKGFDIFKSFLFRFGKEGNMSYMSRIAYNMETATGIRRVLFRYVYNHQKYNLDGQVVNYNGKLYYVNVLRGVYRYLGGKNES